MANNKINSRSGLSAAKSYIVYAIPLMIAIGCSAPEEKEPAITQPVQEIAPPKPEPKMDTVDVDFGLGQLIFQDGYIKKMDPATDVDMSSNGSITILRTKGKVYLLKEPRTPDKKANILEINGQNIRFIDKKLALVIDNNISYLSDISTKDTLAEKRGPAVSAFLSIQDNIIGEKKDISEIHAQGQGTVLFTPDNKKIFYASEFYASEYNSGLELLIYIQDLTIEKDYISLQTSQGKLFYDGPYHGAIPYDKIIDRKNTTVYDEEKRLIIKDGNIMNFEPDQARYFLEGKKNETLVTQSRPEIPEKTEKQRKSLNEALEAEEKPVSYDMIITNATNQFKNFKIKYVGVSYGEGTYYAFSSDGKTYYNFQKDEKNGNIIVNKSWGGADFDEIISEGSLPTGMLISKTLTGNYQTTDKDDLHYLGASNGAEQVVYTIQGASGSHVQNGGEVQAYLDKEYGYTIQKAENEGYEFLGYFVDNKKLTATTPCPKGTKIYLRYKKK